MPPRRLTLAGLGTPLAPFALALLIGATAACSSSSNNVSTTAATAASTRTLTPSSPAAASAVAAAKSPAAGSPAAAVPTSTAAGGAAPAGGADDPKSITMAFVPSQDLSTIQVNADKIAQYLTKELNRPVRSVTLTSYSAVSQALSSKTADLAWVGPLDYLISHEQNGAYPITCSVRNGTRGYKAFIIAKSDSSINGVADLKGKSFAFGDPVSASSSLIPKGAMIKAGLNPDKDIKSTNISNQGAVAAAVYEGKVDAGAIFDDARLNVKDKYPDILDKTKIIYTSDLIPCDPQIVRKDLTKSLVDQMQASLLKLSNDAEGKTWLKSLFTIDALSPATDADYDGLRQTVKTVAPDLLKGYPSPTATPAGTPAVGATPRATP